MFRGALEAERRRVREPGTGTYSTDRFGHDALRRSRMVS